MIVFWRDGGSVGGCAAAKRETRDSTEKAGSQRDLVCSGKVKEQPQKNKCGEPLAPVSSH